VYRYNKKFIFHRNDDQFANKFCTHRVRYFLSASAHNVDFYIISVLKNDHGVYNVCGFYDWLKWITYLIII
jgi:hypothetical protein